MERTHTHFFRLQGLPLEPYNSSLQEQAKQLVSRLDATDLVHGTSFAFNPIHGKEYHIYLNSIHNKNQMGLIGPKDWTGGKPPEHLTFVASAIKKGDSTWEYVDEDSVSN